MSNSPTNPFDPNTGQPAAPTVKKKSNVWLWVIGIIGGLGLVAAIACCGSVFWAYNFGMGKVAEAVKADLMGNPVIGEHIGDIEELSMNLTATGEEQQNGGKPNTMVMDVKGSKGSGQLILTPGQGGGFSTIELELPDGTRHQAAPLEEFDLDFDMGGIDMGDAENPDPGF